MNQDPDNYPYNEKDYMLENPMYLADPPEPPDPAPDPSPLNRIATALETIAEDLHRIAECASFGIDDLGRIRKRILEP